MYSDSEVGEGDEEEFYSTPPVSPQSAQQRRRLEKSKFANVKCFPRIDALAEPGRRHLLALYEAYKDKLPPDKVEKIKMHLQELYAMTAEESEKYFQQLNERNRLKRERRRQKSNLRKLLKQQKQIKEIICAYKTFYELLKRGMEFAVNNASPPIVTVRLRNLSNIILEHLCDLRKVEVPQRNKPSKLGIFLIAVADWAAVFVEHVYYNLNVLQDKEAQQIKEKEKQEMAKQGPVKIVPSETVKIKQLGEESTTENDEKSATKSEKSTTESGKSTTENDEENEEGGVTVINKDDAKSPDEVTESPTEETDEEEN